MRLKHFTYPAVIFFLFCFRTFLGIQVNFTHEDYFQIYSIGLKALINNEWPFWGPDIVWSQTQLPGALQGLLVMLPIKFLGILGPIIVSNLISTGGLVVLGNYIAKQFENIQKEWFVPFLLLLPFYMFNGMVLLNTAYLLFTGALLAIAIHRLFVINEDFNFGKDSLKDFFYLGLGLSITFQLHLTWVVFFPFIVVILGLVIWKSSHIGSIILILCTGVLIGGVLVLPTYIKYFDAMFVDADKNVVFQLYKLGDFVDLLGRYCSLATTDFPSGYSYYKETVKAFPLSGVLVNFLKIGGAVQMVLAFVTLFFMKENFVWRRLTLVWFMSLLLAFCLHLFGNKYLSTRTYIVLYGIVVITCFYAIDFLIKRLTPLKWIFVGFSIVSFLFHSMVLINSYHHEYYSFYEVEKNINEAIEIKDVNCFGIRRASLMENLPR